MGLFDRIQQAKNEISADEEHIFTFKSVPSDVGELASYPESSIDTPFKTAALTLLALMSYEYNKEAAYDMLSVLKGPAGPLTPYDKQFLKDRLTGKEYKVRSFFEGAVPENNYLPTQPLKIKVSSNTYSKIDDTHMTLYVHSGGADSPRPISLRLNPSTNEWFLNDKFGFLADIRVPKELDEWA